MGLIVFGTVVFLIGVALASNSLDLVDRLATHWPARFSRSSGSLMASTSFLIRFISLLVATAGAAIVASAIFYG
jgi:hypothetical protein